MAFDASVRYGKCLVKCERMTDRSAEVGRVRVRVRVRVHCWEMLTEH